MQKYSRYSQLISHEMILTPYERHDRERDWRPTLMEFVLVVKIIIIIYSYRVHVAARQAGNTFVNCECIF